MVAQQIVAIVKNFIYLKKKKNASIDDMLSKRPNCLEVNLDFELEKLLKEIHYMTKAPFNMDLTNLLKNKFKELKDENKLRYRYILHSIIFIYK
jgi:hypothetical protein